MDRPFSPSLAEMTAAALAILEQNPNGYFLVVEGALIGHRQPLPPESQNVIDDVIGFDEAVAVGVAAAEGDEEHAGDRPPRTTRPAAWW